MLYSLQLPILNYAIKKGYVILTYPLARLTVIEPMSTDLESVILPLNYRLLLYKLY